MEHCTGAILVKSGRMLIANSAYKCLGETAENSDLYLGPVQTSCFCRAELNCN